MLAECSLSLQLVDLLASLTRHLSPLHTTVALLQKLLANCFLPVAGTTRLSELQRRCMHAGPADLCQLRGLAVQIMQVAMTIPFKETTGNETSTQCFLSVECSVMQASKAHARQTGRARRAKSLNPGV